MNEEEMNGKRRVGIQIVVLETLSELLDHVRNYSPDKWQDDFKYAVEQYLSELDKLKETK